MPDWPRYVRDHLPPLPVPPPREREIVAELAGQLEQAYQEALAAGVDEAEARRRAAAEITDWPALAQALAAAEAPLAARVPPGVREALDANRLRAHRGGNLLADLLQDLRYAVRSLRRSPGFTAVVLLTLAVGIGANAAIFSLINAVLLRTLPVPAPAQIFALTATDGVNRILDFSYPVLQQMERAAAGAATLGANSPPDPLPLRQASGASLPVESELVSGGYFSTLGIQPWRGRWINAGDNRALGASPVAVLSYGLWMRLFGGDPGVLGRTVTLHGVALDVVGIAPQGFSGTDPAQPVSLWAPLMMQTALHARGNRLNIGSSDDQPWAPQEGEFWLEVFARLRDPGRAAALTAALSPPVTDSFHRLLPDRKLAYKVAMAPYGQGGSSLRRDYGAPLRALMILVALMLLIAVANVATLLLARMVRRRHETAIRLALGISRARLVRQLLTEGMALALLAGLAAIGVAAAVSRLMVRLAAAPFRPDLDWRVWAFLAAVALCSGLCLGLLPAWQARRGSPAEALRSGAEGSSDARTRLPLGRWLVVGQIAFALLLVACAGLFSRSLAAMYQVNLGFDRAHILTAGLALPDTGVPAPQLAELDQRLLQRVAALPGVRAAALDQNGLDDGSTDTSGIALAGRVAPPGGLHSNENTVSRDFFAAVGMHLVRGRGFLPTDTQTGRAVVVVNQAFVRRFYPGENPLGKTFGYDAHSTGQFQIVGVAADARVQDPHQAAAPLFYRPLGQSDHTALKLEVRTAGDPAALASAVRTAAGGVDARLRVVTVSSVNHRVGEMLLRDRLVAELSGGFGLLALALAGLGLYGVMAYAVGARRGEFGVRMALGSTPSQVLGLVVREAALLVAVGLALGLLLMLWAAPWLQPLLPGVDARNPATLATVAAVLLAVALLASYFPARRASHIEPWTALRYE